MPRGAARPQPADMIPRAPRKNYCLTLWPEHSPDPRTLFDHTTMTYLVVGDETCPETGRAHYQCFVQFIKKVRWNQVKAIFGAQSHVEACRGSPEQNRDYCTKDGNFTEFGDMVTNGKRTDLLDAANAARTMTLEELMEHDEHGAVVARHMAYFRQLYTNRRVTAGRADLRAKYQSVALRPWQSRLLDILKAEPNPRIVYWFWDAIGNTGKSWFASYVLAWNDATIFTNGKIADMAFAYNYEPIVIIDLARTQADHCDHFYQFMESLKNGVLFSSKYESGKKLFKPPHVVVFANFEPDRAKLSADRWKIHELTQ